MVEEFDLSEWDFSFLVRRDGNNVITRMRLYHNT